MKDNNDTENLYKKLSDYSHSDFYPFHMPGHKRNNVFDLEQGDGLSPYLYDITEIEGFDNLHHPQGIIKESMDKASNYYNSQKSYFLVNGSTCGVLSAVSAATEHKKTIIMARNSHKSCYNAVFLQNLNSEYVYPAYQSEYGIFGGISREEIKNTLDNLENLEDVGAVFITSPTYEGVVSDIRGIADIVHEKGIALIVDEAHGAHFGMNEYFPSSALTCGADIVIQSLHKTLPSFTQTAILHITKNSIVSEKSVEKYLSIFQSSSPSYILMAGIDRCIDYVFAKKEEIFKRYIEMLDTFRQKCRNLNYFKLFYLKDNKTNYDYDRSKLVIIPDKKYYTGKKLYDKLLEKYHLQVEMASEKYVIALTSVNDNEKGFERLYLALEDLEREIRITLKYREIYSDGKEVGRIPLQKYDEGRWLEDNFSFIDFAKKRAVVCRKIREASFEKFDFMNLNMAKGKISEEFIYLYPPGVPILAPGEIITEEIIKTVERYKQEGLSVQGLEDEKCEKIKVVQENWSPIDFSSVKFE